MTRFTSIRDKLTAFTSRILIGITVGFLAGALLIGFTTIRGQHAETKVWIEANLVSKGRTLVTNNSLALRGMIEDNAFLAVRELVASTVGEDGDAVAGMFMDADRQPWVLVTPDNLEGTVIDAKRLDDSTSLWAHTTAVPACRTTSAGDLEFAAPVMAESERLGTIRYTLSTAGMSAKVAASMAASRAMILKLGTLMLCIAALIYYVGSRAARKQAAAITRPIGELTRAAETIAGGNYGVEVTTSTDDEVGILAKNFEIMRRTVKEYAGNLEEKVAERTKDLDEAMLELRRSNTELEQFAYVASHDLQEPLRMITSYLGLIEKRYREKLDDAAHEFIGFAVDGAARMRRLINDLLTYSRIGTRGKPFAETPVADVYSTALKNLEIAISERGASVSSEELPTIVADKAQLVQLFQNLIGNALKFCKDRSPAIHVVTTPDAGEWIFGIKDNGIGIAPENRDRIFQIFQRLHTREEYEGTGIGLAVCKKIIERHDGRIWVESEVGKGTTFWLAIPKTLRGHEKDGAVLEHAGVGKDGGD